MGNRLWLVIRAVASGGLALCLILIWPGSGRSAVFTTDSVESVHQVNDDQSGGDTFASVKTVEQDIPEKAEATDLAEVAAETVEEPDEEESWFSGSSLGQFTISSSTDTNTSTSTSPNSFNTDSSSSEASTSKFSSGFRIGSMTTSGDSTS